MHSTALAKQVVGDFCALQDSHTFTLVFLMPPLSCWEEKQQSFFDLGRSPNTCRASGEGRKGALALLHVQRYASLEGAAPGTTRKKFAFF